MRKIITIVILFISSTIFAQGSSEGNTIKMPNYTPPSPEAFQMTKYGDVPIDEFNGKVNLSIPLCEFTAGQLKLPMSLSYNGAGVKVKDVPTQVGINWMLNAGGLISREVRDLADETATRINMTPAQMSALNQADCTSQAATLRGYVDNYQNDTETDIFNFNFNGYSGSFYLDDSFIPKLTKNDNELRIEIIGNLNTNKTFLITDPAGIKYYFGGTNACEISAIENIVNGRHDLLAGGGITSFYLYKIEHPTNGVINIEYETKSNYHYTLNQEFSKTKPTVLEPLVDMISCSYPNNSYSENLTKNYINNPKYIKRIYSPNNENEISFERINCNQVSTQLNNAVRTVLKTIKVKNNNVDLQNIDLNYLGLNDLNLVERFFLSSVALNNVTILNGKNQVYRFEYNHPLNLPNRYSKKIDRLGYFNNKNNQDLYPCFSGDYAPLCPDRSSNFEYASYGVLKKVIYPTKGYTEFEYEPNPVVEKKYTPIGADTYGNLNSPLDNDPFTIINGKYNKLHDELPKTTVDFEGNNIVVFQMPVPYSQTVSISLNSTTSYSGPYDREAKAIMKIINLTTNTTTIKQTFTNLTFNYSFNATHNYKIELDLILPNVLDENTGFTGSCNFQLHTGFHAPNGHGVRLKRTKNFDGVNENIKRYYYKPFHKLNDIQADNFVFNPEIKSGAYIMACKPPEAFFYYFHTIITQTKSSEYRYLDFTYNNLFRDYNNVCVSFGGDNFENGGVEKTFGLQIPEPGFKLEPLTTNMFTFMLSPYINDTSKNSSPNPLNGIPIKEKTFKNIGGIIYKINEKQYNFDLPISQRKINIYGNKIFEFKTFTSPCAEHNSLSNYNIHYYYNDTYAFNKTSETETNYIDPVPANLIAHEPTELDDPNVFYPTQADLELPYRKITATQNYTYGTLRGLPKEITTTVSDGSTKTMHNVYANEAATLTGLTAAQQSSYAKLVQQNNIGSPIQVEQYKGSELLSTQRTLYKDLPTNPNIVLPTIIQTAKGADSLEDRVIFLEYDTKGNPSIVQMKDGTKTKYFYNKDNQVIVKIENYLGALNNFTNPLEASSSPCYIQNQHPQSFVSVYNYDAVTKQITSIIDPKCQTVFYEYNSLHQLVRIKDNDNNIVQEFDHNYKP